MNHTDKLNAAAADIAAALNGTASEAAAPKAERAAPARSAEGREPAAREYSREEVLSMLGPEERAEAERYDARSAARAQAAQDRMNATASKAPGWIPPQGTNKFSATNAGNGWYALKNDRIVGPRFMSYREALDYAQANARTA